MNRKSLLIAIIGTAILVAGAFYISHEPPLPPFGKEIPVELQLKVDKTDVLKYRNITIPAKITATSTEPAKEIVEYLYNTGVEVKTETYSILFNLGRDGNVQSIDIEPQLNIEDLKFNRDILVRENDTISSLILHYWESVQIENVYLEDAFNNAKDRG